MRVFISWSGDRSRRLALALKSWIPHVIQPARTWVSEEDIPKGVPWFAAISEALSDSDVGIIVITPENQLEPWVNYEAGALSTLFPVGRACPLVFDLELQDLRPPISQLNATDAASREDMRRLVGSLVPDGIAIEAVTRAFEREWEELHAVIAELSREGPSSPVPDRSDSEMIAEILDLVRGTHGVAGAADRHLRAAILEDLGRPNRDSLQSRRLHRAVRDVARLQAGLLSVPVSIELRHDGSAMAQVAADIGPLSDEGRAILRKTLIAEDLEVLFVSASNGTWRIAK